MKTLKELEQILLGNDFSLMNKILKSETDYFLFPSKIDGVSMVCTADVNLRRIQVHVNNKKITKIIGLG
jgi:hypothetical protein